MNEYEQISQLFREALKTDFVLTVSEWSDLYRRLPQASSAESGRWRTSRTPFLREIMDELSPSSLVEEVVFMKPAQIGGTECGNNWLGYIIDQNPGPMLYVEPTVDMSKRLSKQRINPTIEQTAVLREKVKDSRTRDSGNTMLSKEFPGGVVVFTGANSAVGLRSMPAKYLYLDEVDGYPGDVDGEGDPVKLAEKRTTTFSRKKILKTSVPKDKNTSRIEASYNTSDQRRFYVPCPFCEKKQVLKWKGIKFKTDGQKNLVGDVKYKCESCSKLIEEHHKTFMLENGEWVAEFPERKRVAGFWLNGLYSPLGWASWNSIVREFLTAKRKEDPTLLKVFVNTVLAETWDVDEGEEIDEESLYSRREDYGPEIPKGVCLLTSAVDCQKDRLECEVIGWGRLEESWSIEYRVFQGDPALPDVWGELDIFLQTVYDGEDGSKFSIRCTCIDTGGHHTKQVYDFVRPRRRRRVFGIKGSNVAGKPIVSRPSTTNKGKILLYEVGTDTAKETIFHRLKLTESGAGYFHFPLEYEQEYFAQLTAEKLVTKYRQGFEHLIWVKTRARNEALDLRVYNMAALGILNPNLGKMAGTIQGQTETTASNPIKINKRRMISKGAF